MFIDASVTPGEGVAQRLPRLDRPQASEDRNSHLLRALASAWISPARSARLSDSTRKEQADRKISFGPAGVARFGPHVTILSPAALAFSAAAPDDQTREAGGFTAAGAGPMDQARASDGLSQRVSRRPGRQGQTEEARSGLHRQALVRKTRPKWRSRHYRKKLFHQQGLLYAEHKHSILVVLQALDAGGKDGTIKHVFAALNPQGARVAALQAADAGRARA